MLHCAGRLDGGIWRNIINRQINCSSFDLCSVLYKDAYQVVFEGRVAGKGEGQYNIYSTEN